MSRLTIANASATELQIAREAFARRYGGVARDGWGPFTLECQGEQEIDRLLQWARKKAKGAEVQEEFAT